MLFSWHGISKGYFKLINIIKYFFKKLNKKEKKALYTILVYIFFVLAISTIYLSRIDFVNLFSVSSVNFFVLSLDEFYIKNEITFILIFCIFIIIWVLLFSFMSPLILLAGYIFGPFLGTFVMTLSHAVAATILFVIVKFYFKTIIEKIITKKLKKIINFLNQNINNYFLFYRILADFGAPPPFHNLIPIFTKIKTNYYFLITLVGMTPIFFAWAYFGHSIRYITEVDDLNFSIFSDPNIYISIILLAMISLIPLVIKKILFKTKAKKKYYK